MDVISLLTRARAFLGLGLAEVQRVLGDGARPVPGDEYGRMENVTSIENPQVFPGTLYLGNETVELVRVGRAGLAEITEPMLRAHCGPDPVCLRSRAGKTANMWVYAPQGVAYSSQGETVHFLEVFHPCSHGEYEARIYREPPDFVR